MPRFTTRSAIASLHFSANAEMLLDGDPCFTEAEVDVYRRWDHDAECFIVLDADLDLFASRTIELGNGHDDVVERENGLAVEILSDYRATRNALYAIGNQARARARKLSTTEQAKA